MNIGWLALGAAALTLLIAPRTSAQQRGSGVLDSLTHPRDTKIVHYSSWDRNFRNDDARTIAPGETLTLVDHRGAGVVRRWWITIAPRNNVALQRGLIVRAWWDDEESPSIEVPVSDFFGLGFGQWKDYVSLPLNMTSGGYNCYWAMPFGKRARITVENRSNVVAERFYYNLDVETSDRPSTDLLFFHAQFRRVTSEAGKPITIVDARGRGHYVGTVLSTQPRRGAHLGYLEGNERIFIDAESSPSYIGTGTEDYFSSGWYFDTGAYSAPYRGAPIVEPVSGRISAYRWHIEDPIPFRQRLLFTLEHGGTNDMPGVDYASVAFWYQTHPHAPFPPLPADLLPVEPWKAVKIAGVVEAEELIATGRVTGGNLLEQEMSPFETESMRWSNGKQLWWTESRPGTALTFNLPAPEAGTGELIGRFTRGTNYGTVSVAVNGKTVVPEFNGYSAVVDVVEVPLGRVALKKGDNLVEVKIIGKDPRSEGWSEGYLVGIDGFLLKP